MLHIGRVQSPYTPRYPMHYTIYFVILALEQALILVHSFVLNAQPFIAAVIPSSTECAELTGNPQ